MAGIGAQRIGGVNLRDLEGGILPMRSDDPAAVRAGLAENGSTLAGVPDLTAAVLRGVFRTLAGRLG